MMSTLLDRKINIGSRDYDGFTARDYLETRDCEVNRELMQMIDGHLINKVHVVGCQKFCLKINKEMYVHLSLFNMGFVSEFDKFGYFY